MSKKNLTFCNATVKKSAFHKSMYPIDISEVHIKKYLKKFHMVKRTLNILLVTRIVKKLDHYV